MFDWFVLCSFVGYLALMLGIGFLFSRRQESLGDYYLGGRRMNKWVVALSAQASDMSGWLLMGLPGAIYVGGFFKVVMKMVSFAWAGFGAAFGPLILLALFWKRTNLAGAVAGMVVGATTCFVWKFVLADYAAQYEIFGLYELAPGFLFALVTTVFVSLATKKPSAEMLAEFDEVSGNIPMDRYLSRVRDVFKDILADDKVTVEETERIRRLLVEMPAARD